MFQCDVAEGVHRIEDSYTNWFLVEEDGRLTVVDAGVPPSWDSLSGALRALGRRHADVEAVVLTHAHFDRIGFAERARSRLGAPVWMHENDVLLKKQPRQYGHELSPLRYVATQPKALPIVASFVRTRAFFPRPIRQVVGHSQRRGDLAERGRLPRLWYDDDVRGGRPDHLDNLRLAPLPALEDVVGQQAHLHRRQYGR